MKTQYRAVFVLVLLAALLSAPLSVRAHAVPDRAVPPLDGVVAVAPAGIEIWFTEEVDAEQLTVRVIGPGGIRVDNDDAALDLYDPERRRVTLSLASNPGPGTYIVQWHTASAIDQDAADGSYRFTVDPSATPIAATPTIEPTAQPAVAVTASDPSNDGGSGDLVALLWPLVLSAVVLLLGVWVVWRRRQRGAPVR